MLPRGSDAYNQVYEDAMERIQSQRQGLRDLSFRVLTWIVHAQRPLTKSEMQHALATTNDALSLDLDNITEVGLLVSVCAGLVTVDVQSNIVRLVHHTAMEYFDRMRTKWFPNGHDEITRTCVTYLSFQDFETGPSPTPNEYKTRIQKYALYEYTARYWGYHARNSSIEDGKPILDFLGSMSKVSASAQAMIYHELGYYDDIQMNGTHTAACFGLTKFMLDLLQRQHDVNLKDKSFGRAPLSWAIENGNEAVVKLLLEHNADVQTKDKSGRTPLILASEKGFEAIARLLIDKNAHVRSRDRDFGRTSLSWASKHGHEAVVRLLLDKGAERVVNSRDKSGNTALTWASRYGHSAVVILLLDNGAATEPADEFSRTPLSWAVINGHLSAVELLLVRDARVDCADKLKRTPLLWAVEKKHQEMVELLLEKNTGHQYHANANQALLVAATTGSEGIVKLLLQNNAFIDHGDQDDRTPLSWAAEMGHTAVIKLLLDNNATIDYADKAGRTPLSWAVTTGRESIVKLLLDNDASIYGLDHNYRAPISWAAESGCENIVRLLLNNHAYIDSLDKLNRTPLSLAAEKGHVGVVQLLLDKMADPDVPDSSGNTPLLWAEASGHRNVVRLLEQNMSLRVDSTDNKDRNALDLAATNEQIAKTQFANNFRAWISTRFLDT
jgi:ankyrin repeat protein